MLYTLNIINKEASRELGIQEDVIEKYTIDVIDCYINEYTMIEVLKYSIKSAIDGFNKGSKFSDEEPDYLKFEDLNIKEKISFLTEVLSKTLDRNVEIYKYQNPEESLELII